MSNRDDILAAVRANLPTLDRPLPWVPMFDGSPPVSLLAAFRESLIEMGGFQHVPNAVAVARTVIVFWAIIAAAGLVWERIR